MTTDKFFMLVRRLSNVDRVFSKTQILLGTLRIQNQLLRESFIFLEVEHSSPLVECFRSKRQYPTFMQQITAVSTEQYRFGLKIWLSFFPIKRTGAWEIRCEGERSFLILQNCGTLTFASYIQPTSGSHTTTESESVSLDA